MISKTFVEFFDLKKRKLFKNNQPRGFYHGMTEEEWIGENFNQLNNIQQKNNPILSLMELEKLKNDALQYTTNAWVVYGMEGAYKKIKIENRKKIRKK